MKRSLAATSSSRTSPKSCPYCVEFAGGPSDYVSLYGRARPNWETSNFRAFPTLGALAEGHLLVAPKTHIPSVGASPSAILEEARHLVEHLSELMRARYGPLILFEHGCALGEISGCGISHAHIHLLPFYSPPQGPPVIPEILWKPLNPENWADEVAAIAHGGDQAYLLLLTKNQGWISPVGELPSQLLRQWAAETLDREDWDWRGMGTQRENIRLMDWMDAIPGRALSLPSR